VADREMARQAFVGILRTVSFTVERALRNAAERLTSDKVFATTFAAESSMSDAEAENIGLLTVIVCEKHGFLWTKWTPEIALVTAAGRYVTGVGLAVRTLHGMKKEKEAVPTN